jgi:uncharacterized protein (TIGR00369 family)
MFRQNPGRLNNPNKSVVNLADRIILERDGSGEMDEALARRAFESAIQDHNPDFETFFLARLFGLTFEYDADTCTVRFPVRDFMFNPQGSLHGGVIAFVMDVASGHLLKHTFGVAGATLEMKHQFLAPVREPEARSVARFLRKGRSICFMEAKLFDSEDNLAVVATSTWRVSHPRPDDGPEASAKKTG